MAPLPAKVTIKDVAERAGVSRTTVSHALNGKGNLSATTIERVRAVATELGYQPNVVARGLRQARLGVLSLVIRPLDTLDTANPEGVDYFLRFTGAAALTALDHGYGLLLVSDPTRPDAPSSALAADGVIVDAPVEDDPLVELLSRRRIPYVLVGVDPAIGPDVPAVAHDGLRDTARILDHLRAGGARRIALVTGTDRNDWNRLGVAGYEAWVAQAGQDPVIRSVAETAGVDGGRGVARELLASPDRPDAAYCLTGRHAAGFAAAALELGLRIPEDLQVVAGSDAVVTRTFDPPITALDLSPEANARCAVNALVGQLEGRAARWPLPGAENPLIVRGSTRGPG